MAITANKGTEKVTGGRENYCGLGTFQLITVNPTVEELKTKVGFNEPKPPVYLSQQADENTGEVVNVVRVDFYLKEVNTGVPLNHSFFVRNRSYKSKAGVTQMTNQHAQFAYGSEYDWFSKEGVREALDGEEDLMKFVSDLTNQRTGKTGDKLYIENWNNIFNGDFSEFKQIETVLDDTNTIGILVGIRQAGDGKQYMTGYKRTYMRPKDSISKITNSLNDPYGKFKQDYMDSLTWQPYTKLGATSEASSAGTTAKSAWG